MNAVVASQHPLVASMDVAFGLVPIDATVALIYRNNLISDRCLLLLHRLRMASVERDAIRDDPSNGHSSRTMGCLWVFSAMSKPFADAHRLAVYECVMLSIFPDRNLWLLVDRWIAAMAMMLCVIQSMSLYDYCWSAVCHFSQANRC